MLRNKPEVRPKNGRRGKSVDEAVHEVIFDGVMCEFGIVLHLHFFEDPRPIGVDGADPHTQIVRDIL
jgi:hypothetical protein